MNKYKTKMVHISEIKIGDVVFIDGDFKTVGKNNIGYCSFMGKSLFGDCFYLGYKPVEKAILKH